MDLSSEKTNRDRNDIVIPGNTIFPNNKFTFQMVFHGNGHGAVFHPAFGLYPGQVPTTEIPLRQFWHSKAEVYTPTRKKVPTKDTTGALRLWLQQHKENPYPSKPEKIMLAILSKMTLTQVSTWFANARRRLKKDFVGDDEVAGIYDEHFADNGSNLSKIDIALVEKDEKNSKPTVL